MIDEERRAALGFRFWDDDSPTDQRKKGTSMPAIQAIVMPKWGLAMEEGMEKGMEKGRLQGILEGILEMKFGAASKKLAPGIRAIDDVARLRSLARELKAANSIDAAKRLLR